jgi:hypothetical protein
MRSITLIFSKVGGASLIHFNNVSVNALGGSCTVLIGKNVKNDCKSHGKTNIGFGRNVHEGKSVNPYNVNIVFDKDNEDSSWNRKN